MSTLETGQCCEDAKHVFFWTKWETYPNQGHQPEDRTALDRKQEGSGNKMLKRNSTRCFGKLVAASAVLLPCFCVSLGWAQEELSSHGRRTRSSFEMIAPYVPSPPEIVEKMLELAQVDSHDRVYDLGSGDGRIVIMAVQKFGAQAVGIELDEKLYEESSKRIAELGLEQRAKIIHGNMFDSYIRPATVVTLYLLTSVNERLRPVLEKQLRPGTRIVSHDFQVPGWKPEKVVKAQSDNRISHTLYLYVRP